MKPDEAARLARAWAMVAEAIPPDYPRPKLMLWWDDGAFQARMCPWAGGCRAVFDGRKIHSAGHEHTLYDAVRLLAHEFGHAFVLWKYGESSRQWNSDKWNERLADQFASRWTRKIMGDEKK